MRSECSIGGFYRGEQTHAQLWQCEVCDLALWKKFLPPIFGCSIGGGCRFFRHIGNHLPDYVVTQHGKTQCEDWPFKDEAQTALLKKPSPYRAVNTFHLGYKNQSVYAISGTSGCLFSAKYKTHKYSVGRAYSCWILNLLVHHVTSKL